MATIFELEKWMDEGEDRSVGIDLSKKAVLRKYGKQVSLRNNNDHINFPYQILSKIENLDDWNTIKELVEEYENSFGSRDLPVFFNHGNTDSFKMSFFSAQFFMSDVKKFIEGEEFKDEVEAILTNFFEWIKANVDIEVVNRNERGQEFEEFKTKYYECKNDIKQLLITKYDFKAGL